MLDQTTGAVLKVPFFLFSRHGQTDWNAAGRWQGRTDVPLNATGRAQAHANAERLRAWTAETGMAPSDLHIISSPLSRAFETASILARGIGRDAGEIVREDRLAELSFGAWEGLAVEEVEARFPEGLAARNLAPWHYRDHGGESYECMRKRILPVLKDMERPTLIVAHGGVLRVLYHLFGGVAQEEAHLQPIRQDVLFRVGPNELTHL